MCSSDLLIVVVGNVDPVQPGMRFDIRRSIVERVLEHAAKARVDDVAIVVAGGLGPRWGGQDIVEALGDRVATSFLPEGRITSHDVTSEDLVDIKFYMLFTKLFNDALFNNFELFYIKNTFYCFNNLIFFMFLK